MSKFNFYILKYRKLTDGGKNSSTPFLGKPEKIKESKIECFNFPHRANTFHIEPIFNIWHIISYFLFFLFFFSSIFSPILWVKLCLSKNICIKNPNLQYHRIGPYLETRSLSMYLIKVRSYWSREGLKSNMAGIFIRKGKGEDAAGRWSYED